MYSFISIFAKVNLALCMVLGIVIALVALTYEAFNAVILGVVVGYLFGSLTYNLLIKVVVGVNPQVLYWSTLITFILFISIAGGFMKAYMVVLATSLVGSYAIVRGISVYAGGYPDETYVMLLLNKGEYLQFGRVFGPMIFVYVGGIFFLTSIGFCIQSFMVPAEKPAEEVKNADNNNSETTSTVKKNEDPVKTTAANENPTTGEATDNKGESEKKTENL